MSYYQHPYRYSLPLSTGLLYCSSYFLSCSSTPSLFFPLHRSSRLPSFSDWCCNSTAFFYRLLERLRRSSLSCVASLRLPPSSLTDCFYQSNNQLLRLESYRLVSLQALQLRPTNSSDGNIQRILPAISRHHFSLIYGRIFQRSVLYYSIILAQRTAFPRSTSSRHPLQTLYLCEEISR